MYIYLARFALLADLYTVLFIILVFLSPLWTTLLVFSRLCPRNKHFPIANVLPASKVLMESAKARISDAQRELLENAYQHGLVTSSDNCLTEFKELLSKTGLEVGTIQVWINNRKRREKRKPTYASRDCCGAAFHCKEGANRKGFPARIWTQLVLSICVMVVRPLSICRHLCSVSKGFLNLFTKAQDIL